VSELRFDLSPVRVCGTELSQNTGQSDGAVRLAGVHKGVGAERIWFGKVSNEAGYRSVPHHHADAETGGYVLDGKARVYYGHEYREYYDLEEGDFLLVPPWMPHIECNRSANAKLVWMTARTPDNLVVNLPDVDLPMSEYTTSARWMPLAGSAHRPSTRS
jgi:uncharacterized RmlC-like cupin family protein